MRTNKHTYENAKGQTITEVLPPGRFLKTGEFVEKGDYRLWRDSKHNIVSSKIRWWGFIGMEVLQEHCNIFYRPNRPKYRILWPSEIIRKGDQLYRPQTRGWLNAVCSCGLLVKDRTLNPFDQQYPLCFTRVRRPIKIK